MKTIFEIVKLSADYLQQKQVRNSRRQAEDLIGEVLGLSRIQLYVEAERPLTELELTRCREYLKRRAQGEPLQYIHGSVQFFDCTLKVTRDVLIPRQETEILVDKIIKKLAKLDLKGKVLWDVCCGSGCIGIALKKQMPDLEVVLSDLSPAALQVAKENALANDVTVEFVCGDLLQPFQGQKAHYVVCNPPYIASRELPSLEAEVREFEPKMALISGDTGLECYMRLAKELPEHLWPRSQVWFEMGTGQGEAIKGLFNQAPWVERRVECDWAGHDRFFFLEIE
ncbi:MAG: peptide chain release factor N(5)-glutamine methyltransferase [Parachlamydiaceae bacterium]|nr:peptide chain release factor N(5)-glutamine methyltransferase [Parachlamydiaceae bacterium]